MTQLRLAVFDLDGTLVELEFGHFSDETERIFTELGVAPPPREQVYSLVRKHQLFHSISESEREIFIEGFWQRYRFHERPGARLISGALQTIESLAQQGFEIAIATARSESADLVYEYLEPTGLEKHLSFISTFKDQPDWRDKVTQLLNLCGQLKLSPSESIMVGDHPKDMLSGESEEHLLQAANADRIIDHVGELLPVIDSFR